MKTRSSLQFLLVVALFFSLLSPFTEAAAQSDAGWQLVGQVGGRTEAVTVFAQTAYLGVGLHVEIYDMSDPRNPALLGSSPVLPGFVESLFTNGSGYLYAACGPAGLQVLDVSDPTAPALVAAFDTLGYSEDVHVVGDYAVLADGPAGILVLDISDPALPQAVGQAYPLAYAYDVEVSGTTVYAAAGGSGLLVVDLTYPAAPVEEGLITIGGFQYGLALSGDRLYTAGAWGGVSVLDISIPLAPVVLETVDTAGWAMDVSVDGGRLLVMNGLDGAALYDLSSVSPELLGLYTEVGMTLQGVLLGDIAYFTDKEKGLLAVDFSFPANPMLASRTFPMLEGRRVAMSGSTAYVAAGLAGMRTIDLSDPARPHETDWYDTHNGYANKVIVDGDLAYLSSHLAADDPLVIFDVSDPLHPEKLGGTGSGPEYFFIAFRSMALSDGYLYIPGEGHDAIVDVRDPQNPFLADSIDMENPVNAASAGDLLVTINNNQLQLLDIRDRARLQVTRYYERRSSGEGIAFLDDATLVVCSDQGIMLLDVSNPSSPARLAELALPGVVFSITIDGTTAYVSTLGGGVQIVDLSDPARPQWTGTIATPAEAYDSVVQGDTLLVADSSAGLLIYQRTQTADTGTHKVRAALQQRDAWISPSIVSYAALQSHPIPPVLPAATAAILQDTHSCVVTTNTDDGPGSLRACLTGIVEGTTVTFDPAAFPPAAPATIQVRSPLPGIDAARTTIDASNAGVILDGSQLESGSGLELYGAYSAVMGMQITGFPENGIRVNGDFTRIGGNRLIGDGPTGQGNVLSGNRINGVILYGREQIVSGNLVGTDATGTQALPNEWGIFVSEWGIDTLIGGTEPGTGNLVSGNSFINLDTWGLRTRVIGNWFGLDITGTRAIRPDTSANIVLESGVANAVIGGILPEERNVISGADAGVIFSDPNSYQNSVIGNYVGTDVTGMHAIPNNSGVSFWTVSYNRVGGTAPGEGNLISGNRSGIVLGGYGVSDNLVLGNIFGLDADGQATLPNNTGIAINTGQRHGTIGGYTPAEGNRIYGGEIGLRVGDPGIEAHYIAGNTLSGVTGMGLFLENRAANNFVQGNDFSRTRTSIRVDYGTGNLLRANTFDANLAEAIFLHENGNLALAAPNVNSATTTEISGATCAGCNVQVYRIGEGRAFYEGSVPAGMDGTFRFTRCEPIAATQTVLLAVDPSGNTSAFSSVYALAASVGTPAVCSDTPTQGALLATATPAPTASVPSAPAASASTPAPTGTGQEPVDPGDGTVWPLLAGGAVGFAALVALIVTLLRKKKG